MNKISKDAAEHFMKKKKFKQDNTEVKISSVGDPILYLFGNRIAWLSSRDRNHICFTLCGWDTTTTKMRLNALGIPVHTVQGEVYCGEFPISARLFYVFYGKGNRPVLGLTEDVPAY